MKQPEVSIIVPLYNSEKYLSRCIDSILSQTFTDFECLLIDDGSTDSSLAFCQRYHQADDRIVVMHQENSGVSKTRNVGLETARGKYICFVDSDDYISQNMIEKLVAAIRNSKADVICCGYIENNKIHMLCDEDFTFSDRNIIEIIHYLEMRQAFGIIWNKLYRKSIIDTYRIRFSSSLRFGEDMIFSLQYFARIKTAYIISDNLYHYLHDNQNALTKGKLFSDEMNFRFETVSNAFIKFDNKAKSIFCAELLAKDFIYTIAFLFRLFSEKNDKKERLAVIGKLKKFYRENRAKNKFRTPVVAVTYKMLIHLPSELFGILFSLISISYSALVKVGKGKARFVEN